MQPRIYVLAARVVLEPELAPLQRRRRDGVERRARGPRRDRGKAQTRRRFAEVEPLVLRELVEPLASELPPHREKLLAQLSRSPDSEKADFVIE